MFQLGARAQNRCPRIIGTTQLHRTTRLHKYLGQLYGFPTYPKPIGLQEKFVKSNSSNEKQLRIGDVSVPVPLRSESNYQHLIPTGYDSHELESQEMLRSLRWMIQKHSLGQDIFLIGPPGPDRRRLALLYCQLLNRECEYLCITRDTTEADLKQRAEMFSGTLSYADQPPVVAATTGRVLVIEGIEKAERNVLPTLNNLLENREMSLEDGRFLVHSARYDKLTQTFSQTDLDAKKLVRVHPDFRVIVLGLPVPRFPGYPLDPPLRSRFQARSIGPLPFHAKIQALCNKFQSSSDDSYNALEEKILTQLVSFRETLRLIENESSQFSKKLPHFPETGLDHMASILSLFPNHLQPQLLNASLIARVFPYLLICDEAQRQTVESTMKKFKIEPRLLFSIPAQVQVSSSSNRLSVTFGTSPSHTVEGLSGKGIVCDPIGIGVKQFVVTSFHKRLLSPMIQDHLVGKDFCVIGEKGCGKTVLIRYLASLLGYTSPPRVYSVHLFKDMGARDLLMRRTTDSKGNTIWEMQTLVKAAISGGLVILDGLDRLPSSTLAVLGSLIQDRELRLPNGTRLMRYDRYNALVRELSQKKVEELQIYPIPKTFRIIALALPPETSRTARATGRKWLVEETMSLFSYHYMPPMSNKFKEQIMHKLFPHIDSAHLNDFLKFTENLSKPLDSSAPEAVNDPAASSLHLSLRQLIKIIRRFEKYPEDLTDSVRRTVLATFLPSAIRETLDTKLKNLPRSLSSFELNANAIKIPKLVDDRIKIDIKNNILSIDNVDYPIQAIAAHPELVPKIVFFNIPEHVQILKQLLKDFICGERHLLLIGNQGVGKNKLADRLLELLNREREYMQLHRDTTVQALTLSPSLVNGVVVYEDSALVKAAENGRVLVIDEADKAPLEVVAILKGLVEDGEMTLSDGRMILARPDEVANLKDTSIIRLHPDFKVIVLANRPGFPFLGNDFFRESGDVFSCHIINNPDNISEKALLRAYGPDVSDHIIDKLVKSFTSLRKLVDEGTFTYPYSTRELVNIVRHLQKFPSDGLVTALGNVLAFDTFDSQVLSNLQNIFHQHGIPVQVIDSAPRRATVGLAEPIPLPKPTPSQTWKISGVLSNCVTINTTIGKQQNKSWRIPLPPAHDVDHWEDARLYRFTEEVSHFNLFSTNDETRHALCLSCAPDGSIYVLRSNPLSILALYPESDYARYTIVDIDDFLPMSTFLRVQNVKLLPLAHSGQIALYCPNPNYSSVIVLTIPKLAKGTTDAFITVIPLPTSTESPGLSTFLDFISPGFKQFKSPRFLLTREGQDETKLPILVNSFSPMGLLVVFTPGERYITVMDTGDINTGKEGSGEMVTRHYSIPFDLSCVDVLHRANGDDHVLIESQGGMRYFAFLAEFKDFQKNTLTLWNIKCSSHPEFKGEQIPNVSIHDTVWIYPQQIPKAIKKEQSHKQVQVKKQKEGTLLPPEVGGILLPSSKQNLGLFRIGSGDFFTHSSTNNNMVRNKIEGKIEGVISEISIPLVSEQSTLVGSIWCPLLATRQFAVSSTSTNSNRNGIYYADFVSIVDHQTHSIKHLEIPFDAQKEGILKKTNIDDLNVPVRIRNQLSMRNPSILSAPKRMSSKIVGIGQLSDSGRLVTLQKNGTLRMWEVNPGQLLNELNAWRRLFGIQRQVPLRLEYESDTKKSASKPKHGKWDGKEHHGGNTWRGGTGGADTAGLGGVGGPYRLDAGNNVWQVSDEKKKSVPEEVKAAAREMAKEELAKRLKEIDMGEGENEVYEQYLSKVAKQIAQLRIILEQAEAKQQERAWLRNQQQGDLDDKKLVDAVTGEKRVYRKRGIEDQQLGMPQKLPKRMHFVLDISGSMYRFNGVDQRLDRLLEATLLIMEAFKGFEHKYSYTLVGHSGDAPCIPLVQYGEPPKSRKERLKVLRRMHAHAQYCMSGDYTVEAAELAIKQVVEQEADDYFVFVLSDANLQRYGIDPKYLAKQLTQNTKVNSYCIFIASLSNEIHGILDRMPPGHAFFAQQTSTLPTHFQTIFTQSTLINQSNV